MKTYVDIFMLLTVLRVRCRDNMCVEVVIKGVDVACISVERRVATASRYLRVCTLKIEFRGRRATEPLEVAHVSKNIRRTSSQARQYAKKCEIAPCVTCVCDEKESRMFQTVLPEL